MTALIKGLDGQIEELAKGTNELSDAALSTSNPLSKIPVLLTDDGTAIYDSAVICEYLDAQAAATPLFPGNGPARWQVLTLSALGDGILDAALLLVYEKRYRPEGMRVQDWTDMQQAKIDDAIAFLESNPPAFDGQPDYGTLTIASALGYLDFRHQGKWRAAAPKMVAWLDRFAAAVPGFAETAPPAA